jgi:hypothetical protein
VSRVVVDSLEIHTLDQVSYLGRITFFRMFRRSGYSPFPVYRLQRRTVVRTAEHICVRVVSNREIQQKALIILTDLTSTISGTSLMTYFCCSWFAQAAVGRRTVCTVASGGRAHGRQESTSTVRDDDRHGDAVLFIIMMRVPVLFET